MRLFIVDDHWVVRGGLRFLAEREPDLTIAGEAGSAQEAVRQARELRPDLTILDLGLPDASGLDILPDLAPLTRVLVLTAHDEPALVARAMKRGARGYLRKDASDGDLLRAIRVVQSGGFYVDPTLAGALLAPRPAPVPPDVTLSPREAEVLDLVARWYTNQEMARRLSIGVRTVETYKLRLSEKLQLHSRAELVRYALAHGLLA